MPIRAVLLDFAGTLLVPVPRELWVARALAAQGIISTAAETAELAARLEAAGRSGGPEPEQLPAELADDYAGRDLSPASHRALYEALISPVTGTGTPLTRRLYDEGTVGTGWEPYPDTAGLLRRLRADGIRVAVVSNVGFDLTAVFRDHGLAGDVDEFVLSYQVGVMKPDPLMFATACERLGVGPAEALMVGDSVTADSGAATLGIPTLLLPYSGAGASHRLDLVLRLTSPGAPG